MKCYVCKAKVSTATRHFMKTQNRREKDQFRDLCDNCYPAQMTKEGYSFKGNCWQKEEAENESLKIDYDVRGEELYEVRKQRDRLQAENKVLLEALTALADWPLRSLCFDGSKAKNEAESLANVRRFARTAIAGTEGGE